MTNGRFPFFHEAETPPGAEGWERMFPYYLVPAAETRQHENDLWFAETMHWSRGCFPLGSVMAEAAYLAAGQNSTRIFAVPTALGLDFRIHQGYVYISPIAVTDPEEIKTRTEYFNHRAGYYFENWDELYDRWKHKVQRLIDDMRTVSFEQLPSLEAPEIVTEGRGRSSGFEVLEGYRRLIDNLMLAWQYHFEFLNLGYAGYLALFQFCREAFPEIAEQTVARMVAGIDSLAFRPDAELRKLAQLACDLGVADVIGSDAERTFEELSRSASGRRWCDAYDEAKDPWFHYFAEYGLSHEQDTWIANPALPLTGIVNYINRLQSGEEIERPVARLREERDALIADYRSLLTNAEAEQFDQVIGLAQRVFPYIEEHNIYIEHWVHSVFWEKARELGDFLVAMGFTHTRDDVFYLNRFEVEQVLNDVVQSWAIGVPARGRERWATEIRERREMLTVLHGTPPQPAFGNPPEDITDPFAVMLYGVTTSQVNAWLGVHEDTDALSGIGGSPGIVEGTVRLIASEKELQDLRPGEILVCPITAPSWVQAFSTAGGIVTDMGGMMSHAAIVCREYGVPAVVGTGFGTQQLRTGDRVRMDGATGKVVIVHAAELEAAS